MQNLDLEALQQAEQKGGLTKYKTYFKLSGPGWIQGAITLGGGSLAGSLFLGVIGGTAFMWLQPLGMILGIIMLSAISYVTLSTEKNPFQVIKQSISPVLAWGWLVATLMANVIWSMPQYNLAQAAVKQNLLGLEDNAITTLIISLVIFVIALKVNLLYQSGVKGGKYIENGLKVLIAIIIFSFIGVVFVLANNGQIDFGQVFAGFIPDFSALGKPTDTLVPYIKETGQAGAWWADYITSLQRDKIIAAFGASVGINMTFILPYSFLKKKWGKKHRGLAIFDLAIGLFVPFLVATSCILITAASQFHSKTTDIFTQEGKVVPKMQKVYYSTVDKKIEHNLGKKMFIQIKKQGDLQAYRDNLPQAEKNLAAMITKRDNFSLANVLEPLAGSFWSQIVFGIGVLGMALSTAITLMMINGFTLCEAVGKTGDKATFKLGCIIAGLGGVAGPFLWAGASKAYLAVPTSVICASLLPIAYLSFFLLMNSKKVMGDNSFKGGKATIMNIAMIIAIVIACLASFKGLMGKVSSSNEIFAIIGYIGLIGLPVLMIIGVVNFYQKNRK